MGLGHGYFESASRTAGKVATQNVMNFLFNFDIARTVQSSNVQSVKKKENSKSRSTDPSCTEVSGGGGKNGKALMCGPYISN